MEDDAEHKSGTLPYYKTNRIAGSEIDVFGPLAFWITLLVIGLIIEVVTPVVGPKGFVADLRQVGYYIIFIPGSIVLPLIVATWIGDRVGLHENGIGNSVKVGILNSAYASLVYGIAIFIVYLLMYYTVPDLAKTFSVTMFVEFLIGLPVAILFILVPLIGALSNARRGA